MLNQNISPYDIEEIRTILALFKKNNLLKKTYIKEFSEIKNLNTSFLWDKLNLQDININNIRFKNPILWHRLKIVNSWIKNASKILDLGFGSGILEMFLSKSKKDISIEGLDISVKSVKLAKSLFPKWKFKIGNLKKTFYKNNKFDYVICLEVLEHISPNDVFVVLKEINRILKSKGFFILSVPLNEDLEFMINNNINYNAHVRIYTPILIKTELLIAGFKILKSKELYAFSKCYWFKNFIINNFIFKKIKKPNNIIIMCQKL